MVKVQLQLILVILLKNFFHTPLTLFSEEKTNNFANTGNARWVQGKKGKPQKMIPSGTSISLPKMIIRKGKNTKPEEIRVRLRFPIFPVYDRYSLGFRESRATRDLRVIPLEQEVNKLKDVVNNFYKAFKILEKKTDTKLKIPSIKPTNKELRVGRFTKSNFPINLQLESGVSQSNHRHEILINWENFVKLYNGETIVIESERNDGHTHTFTFKIVRGRPVFLKCDNCLTMNDLHQTIEVDPNHEYAFLAPL